MGEAIGQCRPRLQRGDGNRPIWGVFHFCTDVWGSPTPEFSLHIEVVMDKRSRQRETGISLQPVIKDYTRLSQVDQESTLKRVKFDLKIQQTSEGDFDEDG